MMPSLTADMLVRAYAMGVFPMARTRDDPHLHWIDPHARGILPLDGFHIPRSLKKTLRSGDFEIRCDTAFESVMRACGEAAPDRPDSWINGQILKSFQELHHHGLAHSVETWREGRLVGGLYGLALGGLFCGESMFSRATDASKVALVHLVARLKRGGFILLDCQFLTEHLQRFGAVEITRDQYQTRLAEALERHAFFETTPGVPWEEALG